MLTYLIRRFLYMIPILIGVNLLTFSLFLVLNTPDDMARVHLGQKYVTEQALENWKVEHGYDKPLFFNTEKSGLGKISETLFFQKSLKLFAFDFGNSDAGRNITDDVRQRMWPSLAIAIPTLILELMLNISIAFLLLFFRKTYLDTAGMVACVALMSISALFYIIFGQYMIATWMKLVPISGFISGRYIWSFLALPIIIGVVSGVGGGVRWYRTLFLNEANKDYVRTARSKGLKESVVYYKHVLRNALIPILTSVVSILPLLFLGSLLLESFFGIPGLGSYTIDAIGDQDFAIVRAMVFLGSFLYIIGLILTDISYTLVDPRIRLQ